ncbi:hypothetical protein HPB49_015144 [Dermacentor silvarum]|uniref:Uncharacterized protein n=1 Tax=Dermacentor silvarum TaxID=543639 RepID=A0ACB8E0S8_DERSI|nr:hypothetical protein HPB49_015144 [Dermacentor silvarum]
MESFLIRFYKDCALPEIVDPRLARSMDVRRPDWNRLAIEAKEKTKNGETSKAKRAKYEDSTIIVRASCSRRVVEPGPAEAFPRGGGVCDVFAGRGD